MLMAHAGSTVDSTKINVGATTKEDKKCCHKGHMNKKCKKGDEAHCDKASMGQSKADSANCPKGEEAMDKNGQCSKHSDK